MFDINSDSSIKIHVTVELPGDSDTSVLHMDGSVSQCEKNGCTPNWFDSIETVASDAPIEFSSSHFSVRDKVKDIMEHEDARRILHGALSSINGAALTESEMSSMRDKTLAEFADSLAYTGNGSAPANALQIINAELNKIPKHN